MESVLTLSESAKYLRLAPVTLYRLARRGELPAVKCGRSWRFHREELEQWFRGRARPPSVSELSPADSSFRHLSTRETTALLRFIDLLRARVGRSLSRILLYGSRSRGDFRSDSDIDLLIVLKAKEWEPFRKEIAGWGRDFSLREEVRLQMLILSEEEWKHPTFKSFLLVEQIRREGILLYG